ncbi:MAG: peptide-methionine (S)-S-oxide reductase [Candidatus Zambryskibacteria bacterium RIFCSPHIGHO2_01_FULL_44_22b]|uniref:Peptide methionine sulfoxide reductase MsrA n=2 Tax=Candidatus Zambryskiibacteriota TaxID=1817925 RepID=A0A1G2T0W0_9BACT|nr:MAG: peptide-methionine (S)-S-oxide reductase [Candidatus Zambryskibacteria bacterium RIFCSPHIGHO2_01_FULL_44_22b]OHB06400.1 MAG: peptide-methionine (S)-S-oxide reductase [Candidatus Zambryskibacteria bacterium RIFCSPLOWO2_01_FULL_45_43]
MEKAVFGGGCFWCTEAVFKSLEGVLVVKPGYAGGHVSHPTYLQVASGKTGHAEVTYMEYDPNKISYRDLLTVFFASHDPTTLNRQGNDKGSQYRSVIFFTTPDEEVEAGRYIKEIPGAVTTLEPLKQFYEAENYHHDYYTNHKSAPYCEIIINPKLEKVQKQFTSLLKDYGRKAG